MEDYYFSLRAEGPEPARDKILTLQYQPLGRDLGGNLTVLLEWEWGEKEVIRSALKRQLLDPAAGLRPVGFDVVRKLSFLVDRADFHKLLQGSPEGVKDLLGELPRFDLGEFMASREMRRPEYDHLRGLPTDVASIYRSGNLKAILEHLHRERDITLALYHELADPSP